MRARRKGDTTPFEDVYQIVIGRGLYADYIPINDAEIEQEREHISNYKEDHWQDVRERAAIAAMQGTITLLGNSARIPNEIAEFAVACADALVKQLKKGKK